MKFSSGTWPLASVVILVYNVEAFVAEAIESVLAQDYPHMEIIVVNDGSTDGSLGVVQRYADKLTIIDQANAGEAAGRNVGVERARGEYIAFLDADDVWLPGKIAAQVAYMQARADVQLCVTWCEGFLQPGMQPPRSLRPGFLGVAHWNVSPSSWLARKEIFSRLGIFDSSFVSTNDIDWMRRFMQAGYVIGDVPTLLWKKRVHGTNVSGFASKEKLNQYHHELITLLAKKPL